MKKFVVLILCLTFSNCAKVETNSIQNTNAKLYNSVSVTPKNEREVLLKSVTPSINLSSTQQKYLDKSIPLNVREILEKAEKIEVLAEMHGENAFDGEGMTFEPNRIAKVTAEIEKKTILEALYNDASTDDAPASCYEPHHSIRAYFEGKSVELEICFSCSRFNVTSSFGKFEGTISRKNGQLEKILNEIIVYKSLEIKK